MPNKPLAWKGFLTFYSLGAVAQGLYLVSKLPETFCQASYAQSDITGDFTVPFVHSPTTPLPHEHGMFSSVQRNYSYHHH